MAMGLAISRASFRRSTTSRRLVSMPSGSAHVCHFNHHYLSKLTGYEQATNLLMLTWATISPTTAISTSPYGTLEDFDVLLAELKKRGICLLMDLVVNHTSNEHPWFLESKSSLTNPKRDWYIWRQGKVGANGESLPPNNWESLFKGGAWEYDATTDEYYFTSSPAPSRTRTGRTQRCVRQSTRISISSSKRASPVSAWMP
jgi:hypothetical protein